MRSYHSAFSQGNIYMHRVAERTSTWCSQGRRSQVRTLLNILRILEKSFNFRDSIFAAKFQRSLRLPPRAVASKWGRRHRRPCRWRRWRHSSTSSSTYQWRSPSSPSCSASPPTARWRTKSSCAASRRRCSGRRWFPASSGVRGSARFSAETGNRTFPLNCFRQFPGNLAAPRAGSSAPASASRSAWRPRSGQRGLEVLGSVLRVGSSDEAACKIIGFLSFCWCEELVKNSRVEVELLCSVLSTTFANWPLTVKIHLRLMIRLLGKWWGGSRVLPGKGQVMIVWSPDSSEESADLLLEPLAPVGEDAGRQDRVERDHDVNEAGDPDKQLVRLVRILWTGAKKKS